MKETAAPTSVRASLHHCFCRQMACYWSVSIYTQIRGGSTKRGIENLLDSELSRVSAKTWLFTVVLTRVVIQERGSNGENGSKFRVYCWTMYKRKRGRAQATACSSGGVSIFIVQKYTSNKQYSNWIFIWLNNGRTHGRMSSYVAESFLCVAPHPDWWQLGNFEWQPNNRKRRNRGTHNRTLIFYWAYSVGLYF